MRLLAILFAVGAATLAFAALHETHAASTTYTRNVEQAAVAQQARDHEIAQATHVAQVIAHTTGPLPFGLVPATAPSAGYRLSESRLEPIPEPMVDEKIAETKPELVDPSEESWIIY